MTKKMGNLLKIHFFILCMETASALQCTQCSHFVDLVCDHKIETCNAGTDELCMIRRFFVPHRTPKIHSYVGEAKCVKDCKDSERGNGSGLILTYCCDMDFCNDINIPPMMSLG